MPRQAMAVVVLVHGIAQEQKSADVLEEQWLPALAGGVRTAGHRDLADRIWRRRSVDVRMAFYGDAFLRPGLQGASAAELGPEAAGVAGRIAWEWLERSAERASRANVRGTADREIAYLRCQAPDEQGPRAAARSVVKGLARIPWFAPLGAGLAERFLWRSLSQVSSYLTDDSIRDAVLGRVREHIGPETRALVGHSLGSVVAYETAQEIGHALPLLLTLGSPLGLRTVVYDKLRRQPPGYPASVRRWVNVADRDDLIAAEPNLTKMFATGMPAGARFEGGYTVDNGAEPHSAVFYLGKKEVGGPLAESI